MEKKNVILVIVIALILLGVGAFFAINLMRGWVYERIPDPDALTTHSYLEFSPAIPQRRSCNFNQSAQSTPSEQSRT